MNFLLPSKMKRIILVYYLFRVHSSQRLTKMKISDVCLNWKGRLSSKQVQWSQQSQGDKLTCLNTKQSHVRIYKWSHWDGKTNTWGITKRNMFRYQGGGSSCWHDLLIFLVTVDQRLWHQYNSWGKGTISLINTKCGMGLSWPELARISAATELSCLRYRLCQQGGSDE